MDPSAADDPTGRFRGKRLPRATPVDVGTAIGSILAAVGLSRATGLNACPPLLISAALRPASTATTARIGNPVLSLADDADSPGLTIVAFALPAPALPLVIGLVAAVPGGGRRPGVRRGQGRGTRRARDPGR